VLFDLVAEARDNVDFEKNLAELLVAAPRSARNKARSVHCQHAFSKMPRWSRNGDIGGRIVLLSRPGPHRHHWQLDSLRRLVGVRNHQIETPQNLQFPSGCPKLCFRRMLIG